MPPSKSSMAVCASHPSIRDFFRTPEQMLQQQHMLHEEKSKESPRKNQVDSQQSENKSPPKGPPKRDKKPTGFSSGIAGTFPWAQKIYVEPAAFTSQVTIQGVAEGASNEGVVNFDVKEARRLLVTCEQGELLVQPDEVRVIAPPAGHSCCLSALSYFAQKRS